MQHSRSTLQVSRDSKPSLRRQDNLLAFV